MVGLLHLADTRPNMLAYEDIVLLEVFSGAVGEVIDRKLAQIELARATQLAAIGELAASVAHEINNPITGVINYAQILLNRCPAPEELRPTRVHGQTPDGHADVFKLETRRVSSWQGNHRLVRRHMDVRFRTSKPADARRQGGRENRSRTKTG